MLALVRNSGEVVSTYHTVPPPLVLESAQYGAISTFPSSGNAVGVNVGTAELKLIAPSMLTCNIDSSDHASV